MPRRIPRQLDLESTLRAIVEAATSLIDARYGALGVIGADGQRAQLVPVGVTEDEIGGGTVVRWEVQPV